MKLVPRTRSPILLSFLCFQKYLQVPICFLEGHRRKVMVFLTGEIIVEVVCCHNLLRRIPGLNITCKQLSDVRDKEDEQKLSWDWVT